jgi:hypothetical protein
MRPRRKKRSEIVYADPQVIERDGYTIRIHRYGFRPGYYCEALKDGRRTAFTGVFRGKGGKQRAIKAALYESRTGRPSPDDTGCPG